MASGQDGAVLGAIRTLFDAGTSAGLDDAQLLERYLAGRHAIAEASFEALVTRHGPMVLGVCRNALRDAQDAEDAFQATFLVLARRAGSIRRRDALASWLFGVARKVASRAKSDAARRRAREREAAVPSTVEPAPGREPGDLAALFEEIDRLPGKYREPVVLCYLDGMTYEAAARHLGCPVGTLGVRLKRARERLRSKLIRRGVVVPAGLLVAGQGTGAAAVPTSLVGLAVRSAMTLTMGKVTVAGAVSASVASLAGRTVAMMRYKAFGLGMMAFGGVVLAATASLAMKAARAGKDVPEQQAVAKQARTWVRTLPGGVTVELVGVSPYPATPGTWKSPDGEPLPTPPYSRPSYTIEPGEDRQAWEFALHVANLPEGGESRRWKILTPSSGFYASGHPRDAKGETVPGVGSIAVELPQDRRSCTVRFGIASGRWKTVVADGPGGSAQGREKLSVIFGSARGDGGRTAVTISHDDIEDDVRVVAVDLKGEEHAPIRNQSRGVRDYQQMEVEYDLPLSSIKEFRLQTSPFEWVEFADIPLDPRAR